MGLLLLINSNRKTYTTTIINSNSKPIIRYEKTNKDKRFIIVDGAMNDLIRPSLYSAYHKIETLKEDSEKTKADIVGPVCESGDFLAGTRLLGVGHEPSQDFPIT